MKIFACVFIAIWGFTSAYAPQSNEFPPLSQSNRRSFLKTASFLGISGVVATTSAPKDAEAVGPVKLNLKVNSYSARICPPDRPIPGEKAMKGMKGLCVTVNADVTGKKFAFPTCSQI